MSKHGKKYLEAAKLVDSTKAYAVAEAVDLAKKTSFAKFDASIDLHMNMNLDPRKAEQQIRGIVLLPSGAGKTVRILVFAEGEAAINAQQAGADYVGSDDLVTKIQGGWFEFDAMIATPDMMSQVGKLGKLLGPRGLMPNPKVGTVTFEVDKAVRDIKAGKIEYRVDRQGNLHLILGKKSFDEHKLLENYVAVLEEIVRVKPAAAKGRYLRSITLSISMGPGIKVDPMMVRDILGEAEATA